jgi:hypothetical protein
MTSMERVLAALGHRDAKQIPEKVLMADANRRWGTYLLAWAQAAHA